MKFSEVQLTVAADQAIAGIQKHVPALGMFAHSFTPAASSQYTGVAVPVFANLSGCATDTANAVTGDVWIAGEELQAANVNLGKVIRKVYSLTDYEAANANNLYLADASRAIAEQVTLEAVKDVFQNTLADSNLSTVQDITTYTTTTPSAKAGFAALFGIAESKGINPYDSVVVLKGTAFSSLLSSMGDSYVYGGPELVRSGIVENLYGFRGVINCPFMPAGVDGFIIPWNTLGLVSRWDKPAIDGYADTWTATDDKTGFTIGYRVFEDLRKGTAYIGGSVLFGSQVLQKGIITLKPAG